MVKLISRNSCGQADGIFILYTIYLDVRENEWNISFNPYIPEDMDSVKFKLTVNNRFSFNVLGERE